MTGTVRARIDRGFEGFARAVFRHPWLALLIVLPLLFGLLSQLPKITIDTATESFLSPDDPILLTYNDFRDRFGRDELIFIAVDSGDGVFQLPFLERLRELHQALGQAPHVDEITSLINARNTQGSEGALIVGELMEEWPRSEADLARIEAEAMANPTYRNMLLSEDGRVTSVVIRSKVHAGDADAAMEDVLAGFDAIEEPAAPDTGRMYLSDEENSELVRAVQATIEQFQADGFRIHMAGSPVTTDLLKAAMKESMARFMMMALIIIGVALYLMFRRASGVMLPFTVVVFSLFGTIGMMAALGTPIKMPTQILPSFLLAVGVGASVHLLALFYRQLEAGNVSSGGGREPRERKEQAIVHAVGHSGLPVVMTSLTTAAGLGSFAFAELGAVADLGRYSAAGVLLSLLLTLTLIPALLALMPLKSIRSDSAQRRHARLDRLLSGIGDFATGNPRKVLAVSGLLVVLGMAGITRIDFSHDPLSWLPESSAVRGDTAFIDQALGGTSVVEILVDTGQENGLYQPQVLNALERAQDRVDAVEQGALFVGKTQVVSDVLKETHKALNENRPEFYRIPQDPDLIAQEFLLFENSGSDDLELFVDSAFSTARFSIKVPWMDATAYPALLTELEAIFQQELGDAAEITTTGLIPLLARTISAAIISTAESYLWAALVISGMMVLLIGELRLGLIAMIPNLSPIIIVLGLMGWLGLSLDMFTMLIGSIAIGLAVDDTIHFMHNFRRYHQQTGDTREAVRLTLTSTGRALLVTSVVLATGFLIYVFSVLNNLFLFGIFTGLAIILALLSDFLMAPALMAVLERRTAPAGVPLAEAK